MTKSFGSPVIELDSLKKMTCSSLPKRYLLFVPLIEATERDAAYVEGEPTVPESGLVTKLVLPLSPPKLEL